MNPLITNYFKDKDLDIRKKNAGFSRFMDQKITPDVLAFVAESISHYLVASATGTFTSKDIEKSDFFVKNVSYNFNKPSPTDTRTASEYDKWSAQIIQTLRFAQIIEAQGKKGSAVLFRVKEPELLAYIATRTQNAYAFLVAYVTKVLQDSGFYSYFENYRDLYISGKLTQSDFEELKEKYQTFTRTYTDIKGDFEPRRIFPKVINILASEHRVPGTISGRMSKYPFLTSDLVYNRINFRDRKKSKTVSRTELQEQSNSSIQRQKPEHRIAEAKKRIKQLHPNSEVNDQWANGEATQIHHIFPENEFPQLADRLENLIRLTPTQHNTKAHPSNKTTVIDRDYQQLCLLEKSYSIEQSINKGEFDYSKESFVGVINAGLGINISYESTFDEIRLAVKKLYAS